MAVPLLQPVAALSTESNTSVEVIIVSAQRTDQPAQDVPMAVTALSEEMIDDRQVITFSDLQLNVPNMRFSNAQFGPANISIRGIGKLVYTPDGEPGVSVHLQSLGLSTNLTSTEFYDLERVEVLRGPQGTLYGRNATGGVINLITRRPLFDGFGGYVDLEGGDYDHRRIKGALNLPLGDAVAFRIAGLALRRDGYIENRATDQIPGLDEDLDGRDLYSYRISGEWRAGDGTQLWGVYQRFAEDDDRARVTTSRCKKNPFPTAGCVIDGVGRDAVNWASTFGGITAGLTGIVPLGASDESNGLQFEFPRPEDMGPRDVHTDLDPVYDYKEDLWLFGIEHDFSSFRTALIGGYREWEVLSRTDWTQDVGPTLLPTPQNPTGLWPTSAPHGRAGDLFGSDSCDLQGYRGGIFGGCVLDVSQTRAFAYDQVSWTGERWAVEARIQTSFDGAWNFLLGANYTDSSSYGEVYVGANLLDAISLVGAPAVGYPPLYPGFSVVSGNPDGAATLEGPALFGEVYWQVAEDLRLTVGMRYNVDRKRNSYTTVFYDSLDMNAISGNAFGPDPVWVRVPMFIGWVVGDRNEQALWLAERYGATGAILEALDAGDPAALVDALQLVPPVPTYGESRDFEGGDDEERWDALTGRLGLEWTWADGRVVYAFYSRGYKAGGFNPPTLGDGTYENESVNAYEVGSKNLFLEGSLLVNTSAFFYDYINLQTARGANGLGFQDNLDAKIMGLELESTWRPNTLPQLQIDLAYGWLDTEIQDTQWIDEADRAQGNPDYVLLKNVGPAAAIGIGINYIAPIGEVLPLVDQAIIDGAALPAPGTVYPNGIPAYFDHGYLAASGVAASSGFAADLDGNSLPNAPEHNVRLGFAYTWSRSFGSITARYDHSWQSDAYAREYNRPGDEIDSWDQHNASITYDSPDGSWQIRGWIRNITDEDNVTGHFLADDLSGQFRNLFLTEPRIFGASVRYRFGG